MLFFYDVHQACQSNQIPLVECDNLIGLIIWESSLQVIRGSLSSPLCWFFFVREPLIQGNYIFPCFTKYCFSKLQITVFLRHKLQFRSLWNYNWFFFCLKIQFCKVQFFSFCKYSYSCFLKKQFYLFRKLQFFSCRKMLLEYTNGRLAFYLIKWTVPRSNWITDT